MTVAAVVRALAHHRAVPRHCGRAAAVNANPHRMPMRGQPPRTPHRRQRRAARCRRRAHHTRHLRQHLRRPIPTCPSRTHMPLGLSPTGPKLQPRHHVRDKPVQQPQLRGHLHQHRRRRRVGHVRSSRSIETRLQHLGVIGGPHSRPDGSHLGGRPHQHHPLRLRGLPQLAVQ